jgi:hypothetical protein
MLDREIHRRWEGVIMNEVQAITVFVVDEDEWADFEDIEDFQGEPEFEIDSY